MNVRILALLAAIVGAAALRLVPHPPNFSPIAAMALFGGAYLGRRWIAFVAPFAALLLSDLVLGFYAGIGFVYASFALVVVMGWWVSERMTVVRVGAAALSASVVFFVLTNFGMWLFSGFYPVTLPGLAACFAAAVPFFQNTVAGDLFYTTILFGGFALLSSAVPAVRGAGKPRPA